MAFWFGLVVWVVISPVLVVRIGGRELFYARLRAFGLLHNFNILFHIDRILLSPFREFVKVDALAIDRPDPISKLFR